MLSSSSTMASSLPILIVNPNTTTAMTDGLKEMLAPFVTVVSAF